MPPISVVNCTLSSILRPLPSLALYYNLATSCFFSKAELSSAKFFPTGAVAPFGCGNLPRCVILSKRPSLLLSICCIHRISSGNLIFGEKVVNELTPQERNVNVVFQNYALYPHMTVFENIALPLRIRKSSNREIDQKVKEVVGIMRIEELLKLRPSQLSGGQQQRVALARALVKDPDVLLMDEPLANLDAKLRLEMRSEVRRIQKETGTSAILVTHDQVEAMSMCDRIALMNQGKIQQIGEPTEMYDQPNNMFVAGFLGNPPISFYEGYFENCRFKRSLISFVLPINIKKTSLNNGSKITLGIRPENFQPEMQTKLHGKVSFIEPLGRETFFDVTLQDGNIIRSIQNGRSEVKIGETVNWGIDINSLLFFDDKGQKIEN